MAPMLVWNSGSNTSPYDTWAKAATSFQTAATAQAVGEDIWVASDHDEKYSANTTLTIANSTVANPTKVISVDRTDDSYENMEDGGGAIDAKTNGAYDIVFNCSAIFIGMKFRAGDVLQFDQGNRDIFFYDSLLEFDDDIVLGAANSDNTMDWTDVRLLMTTNARIRSNNGGKFNWRGGSLSFGAGACNGPLFAPTTTNRSARLIVEDVDFSNLGASDYLVMGSNKKTDYHHFNRCKLPASFGGILASPLTNSGRIVIADSCSSSDVIHDFEHNYYEGVITDETSIYLNAEYDDSGNNYSAKFVSSAYAEEWTRPLKFLITSVWSDANPTITVELVLDSATTLNDDDFWLEIEYPDGTTRAFGQVDVSSRPATILTTPSALTSSSVSWTGTGGFSNEQKRKVAVTIASGQAGIHTIWACLGKPSTTVYVDPQVALS